FVGLFFVVSRFGIGGFFYFGIGRSIVKLGKQCFVVFGNGFFKFFGALFGVTGSNQSIKLCFLFIGCCFVDYIVLLFVVSGFGIGGLFYFGIGRSIVKLGEQCFVVLDNGFVKFFGALFGITCCNKGIKL